MDIKKARELVDISLESGTIIPITKASTSLAETMQKEQPTIVTQNGYGVGVIMNIDLFRQLRELARKGLERMETSREAN